MPSPFGLDLYHLDVDTVCPTQLLGQSLAQSEQPARFSAP